MLSSDSNISNIEINAETCIKILQNTRIKDWAVGLDKIKQTLKQHS